MSYSEVPSGESIRKELDRILGSPVFVRARRSSQLLRFLVETKLAGGDAHLKEYSIATDVFGRPESFDPRLDSLVRVEATRLRNRLQSYYESAGDSASIEITLPIGTYIPGFRLRTAESSISTPTSSPEPDEVARQPLPSSPGLHAPQRLRMIRMTTVALALVCVGAGGLILNGRLWEGRASGLVLLKHLGNPGEVLLSPALTPDSRSVYCASNRGGTHLRIWRQSLQGDDAQAITAAQWDSYDLDLSPDGAWLAYYSNREGGGIYQKAVSGKPEVLIASLGRSPRFSPDSRQVLYWMQDAHTNFGSVFARLVRREPEPEEPRRVAGEFEDAHNPQWTPDGRALLCGTLRTNVKDMEHDLWIVPVGGVEEPVKTGILPYLKTRGIDPHPRALRTTSFGFYQGSLLFAGARNDKTNLYQLRLSAGFQPKGEPIVLREEADSQDSPSLRDGVLAYTSFHSNLNVWSMPLGPDGGSAGEPRRLTEGRADEVFPSVSADGHQLVYLALGSPSSQLWKKDLVTGIESEVYRHTGMNRAKALANGAKAFVRVMDGPAPQLQEIDMIDLSGGRVQRVCDNCGSPTSVSASGDYIMHETGSAVPRLAAFHVPTGRKSEILRHPHHGIQAGRISPDGGWIAFELDRGPDGVQLFVAPFHGLDPIPEAEWVPASDPAASSFEPAWSPDGSKLYFLSDRGGSRDLWMQRLQPNRRPLGKPELLYGFADARLTPLTYHVRHPRYVGLSIAANQAVLTLSELGSSIWLGRLTR